MIFLKVIIVMPMNPATGKGWKKDIDVDNPCKKDIIQCFRENAYLTNEVILNVRKSVQAKEFFHDTHFGIVQSLWLDSDVISHKAKPSFSSFIHFNSSLPYYIAMMDPKLQFWSESPDITPRIMLTMKKNTQLFFGIKV